MEDVYEDFAYSYEKYVWEGDGFRQLAKTNKRLRAKYEFLKNEVFNGREYTRAGHVFIKPEFSDKQNPEKDVGLKPDASHNKSNSNLVDRLINICHGSDI